MNVTTFVLLAANLAMIGCLPAVAFRRDGRFNLLWWATASPFLLAGGALVAARVGALALSHAPEAVAACAVATSSLSIALLWSTAATHRVPLALWHQANDAPVHLVTWGPYRRIRHPYYASFLLALLATALAAPHPATVAAFLLGVTVLTLTARREERRLLSSQFGAEYAGYMASTGRFLPKLWR